MKKGRVGMTEDGGGIGNDREQEGVGMMRKKGKWKGKDGQNETGR